MVLSKIKSLNRVIPVVLNLYNIMANYTDLDTLAVQGLNDANQTCILTVILRNLSLFLFQSVLKIHTCKVKKNTIGKIILTEFELIVGQSFFFGPSKYN